MHPAHGFTVSISILKRFHIFHVTNYHERDLEGNRIFKYSQVQSGALLQLIQSVYKCISVNEELSGCLGYVQRILEELIDCRQGFLVKIIRALATESFLDKHLAQRNRKLLNQSANTK